MRTLDHGWLAGLAAIAALAVAGCADPDARPRGAHEMLARVPGGTSFAVAVDLAAVRDDALARAVGELLPADFARETFAALHERTGIDIEDDLDVVLVYGAPSGDDPAWHLAEAWGRFDGEALRARLREEGVPEEEIGGRPAFALPVDDDDPELPPLWLALDDDRRLCLGSVGGLNGAGRQGDGGLRAELAGDPLLEALDPSAQMFAVYLRPEFDAGRLQEEVPLLGGMIGSLLGGVEGMAGSVRLGEGLSLAGRVEVGREQDARALASILRGGIDFSQVALRQRGEVELADLLDGMVLDHEGAVMRIQAELTADEVLLGAGALVEASGVDR